MDTLTVSGPGKQLLSLIPVLRDRGVQLRPLTFQPEGDEETPFISRLRDLGIEDRVIRDLFAGFTCAAPDFAREIERHDR